MHPGMLVALIMLMDPALAIIGGECASWHVGGSDHADDSMSILDPALATIVGELCILAYRWL